MSVEALWAVRFGTLAGKQVVRRSGGVAVLETNKIFGGDTWTYVTGSYTVRGSDIDIEIQTGVHYTEDGESIFGGPLRPLKLTGKGRINQDQTEITATLLVDGSPQLPLVVILHRAAELP